jgi:hypothetical protein
MATLIPFESADATRYIVTLELFTGKKLQIDLQPFRKYIEKNIEDPATTARKAAEIINHVYNEIASIDPDMAKLTTNLMLILTRATTVV